MASGGDCVIVLRGHHSGYLRLTAKPFVELFFDVLLASDFFGFWCQLGPNLAPTWAKLNNFGRKTENLIF